jgi:RHS repeat-associated protein
MRHPQRTAGILLGGGAVAALVVGLLALSSQTPAVGAAPIPYVASTGEASTLLPDGRLLLTGGIQDNKPTDSVALFDRLTGQRQTLPTQLQRARTGHSATVLPDGRVLILGGVGADGKLVPVAEAFAPVTQTTSLLGELSLAPRAAHTATVLTDGHLLVFGGVGAGGALVPSAQLWDPRSGQVLPITLPTGAARRDASARLLLDGTVLIQGGRDASGAALTTALLYRFAQEPIEILSATDGAQLAEAADQATTLLLADSIPTPEASDVPPQALLSLRFSHAVDVTSINDRTLLLIGPSGAVDATVIPAQDGMLAFVSPKIPLLPATRYTLFADGVTDANGQKLPLEAIGFRTAQLAAGSQDGATGTVPPSTGGAGTGASGTKPGPPPGPSTGGFDLDDDELFVPTAEHRGGRWRTGKSIPDAVRDLLDRDERVRDKIEARRMRGAERTDFASARTVSTRAASSTLSTGATGVAGTVLRLNDRPLANVTVSIGNRSTRTDAEGHFALTGLAPGHHEFVVDGSSANAAGRAYAQFVYSVDIKAGRVTDLPHALYLPRVRDKDWFNIASPTQAETVVVHPDIPGLEIRIPPGTVIRDRAGRLLTRIAIVPVPLDRAPFPTPANFPTYFLVHPGGAIIQGLDPRSSQGVRIVYPNYTNDAPGAEHSFWLYDTRERGWFVYGKARVSPDGQQIVPDPGVGLHEQMVGGHSPPQGPEGPEPPIKDGDDNPKCGDPVDCQTGVFLHTRTDVALPDVLPIAVTRTYRPGDTAVRPFGIGTNHNYGMYLRNGGTTAPIQVVLPNGARINFKFKSGTVLHTDYTWEHTGSTGRFYGATMTAPTDLQFGEVYRMTLKDGSEYDFGLSGVLVRMKDRFGNRLTFTWSGGQLQRIVSPNGRYLDFTYDTSSRITQIRDLTGRIWTYTYNAGGTLERATVPGGSYEEYTYDTAGRMLTVRDRRGNTMVTNVYDANGRVQRQTLAGGAEGNGIWQFAYVTDFYNNVTQTTVTKPRNNVIRFTWGGTGYLATATGAVGTALERTTTYERQPGSGLLTALIDTLSRRTERFYDDKGNVTRLTYLAGTAQAESHVFTYEPVYQQLASYTDPLGKTWVLTYDASNRLSQVIDPLGNILVTLTYNEFGHPLTVANGAGHTTTYTYDLGDLTAVTDPLGRTTQAFLDTLGRPLAITDPLGRRQRYAYDDLDRLTQFTDALGKLTALGYDNNNNLTSVTDARSGLHQYAYDAKNRLETQTDPLGRAQTFGYDSNDNLTRYTDRKAQITNYYYDLHDRRIQATFADAKIATYRYDFADRLRQATDPFTGTVRDYDDLNRLFQESDRGGGRVNYTYNSRGLRTGLTARTNATGVNDYPVTTNYTYDDARRLTQITQGTASVSFTYDAAQRRRTVTLPTGIVATYDYDAASQLTGISYQNGTTEIGNLTYSYDLAGNRINIGGSLARTNLPVTLSAATHNAANQLTAWNGGSLIYDNNGNLTSDNSRSYTWDVRNRLTATFGVGGSVSYQYDPFGRRTYKTVNGVTTNYQYDGQNLVREMTAGNVPTATFLAGLNIDEQFRRTDHGTNTSNDFLTDALGSVLALTDGSGAVQTSYTYGPFGNTSQAGAASANPVQYTGRENDGTGLYYYRARYYDPKIQRFISSDPIGLAGGLNTYAYVENNPIAFIDPHGLRYRTQPRNLPPQNSRTGGSNYKGDWYPNLGTTEPRPGSPFRTPSDRVVRDRPEMPPLRDEDFHKALEELPDFTEKALKDLLDKIRDRDILRDLDDRLCRP